MLITLLSSSLRMKHYLCEETNIFIPMIELPDNLKEIFPPEAEWYGMHVTLTGKGEKYLKDHGIELKRTDDGSCWGEDVFALIQQDPNFLLAGPIKKIHSVYSTPHGLCYNPLTNEVEKEIGTEIEFVNSAGNSKTHHEEIEKFLSQPAVKKANEALRKSDLMRKTPIDKNWQTTAPGWQKACLIEALCDVFGFNFPWLLCTHLYKNEEETWRQKKNKRQTQEKNWKQNDERHENETTYDNLYRNVKKLIKPK